MKNSEKARKALDDRYKQMKLSAFARPPKGWLKAVRNALGLTIHQLAKRMRMSQPTLSEYEKREIEGSLTLNSLEKAAQAMNCRLIYAIVPNDTLEHIVQSQAEKVAKKTFSKVEHSMQLEKQSVNSEARKRQFENFLEKLKKEPRHLWDIEDD